MKTVSNKMENSVKTALLKELYTEMLELKHFKPINYLGDSVYLSKRIKKEERASGKTNEELDVIFEEAKNQLMIELGIVKGEK